MRMGHTLLCVLWFFLLITLQCGNAEEYAAMLEIPEFTLFEGDFVTLRCKTHHTPRNENKATFFKDGSPLEIDTNPQSFRIEKNTAEITINRVSDGGNYTCKFDDGAESRSRELKVEGRRREVTLTADKTVIPLGSIVTLSCSVEDPDSFKYEWFKQPLDSSEKISVQTENDDELGITSGGKYTCRGWRSEPDVFTPESEVVTIEETARKPKAELRADVRDIPVGGSVTLTCSVNPPSSGWKYFWYRGEKTSEALTEQDVVFLSNGKISVSQGGLYWCRGGRGEPVYYTEYSDPISNSINVANKAVVTLQPNWSEIYSGETITLRCEIKDGGDMEWEYEWKYETTSSKKPSNQNEVRIRLASVSHSGDYSCKGRMKSERQSSTVWSDPIKLTISDKPQPVLTVSPLWLSPGDSVTLNCKVKHPSEGWRFYWYEVAKLSENYYNYELLPDSASGTEQDSYIVHGQTHTTGYVCGAGRGDPVYYTYGSEPKFVWSADIYSSASLTVSPDRMQYFTSDTVSVNCEGNSTEWRVRRFTENSYTSYCSDWGTMAGSTCNINSTRQSDAVYWCESASGESSNAVNITIQESNIILVSPVHPVTEGDSVSVSCKLRTQEFVSGVFFYRNGELIQNDTRGELNIFAVSKSDEGFYKCQHAGQESAQSWMSVKAVSRPDNSSLPGRLIFGLVCGIILVILLLLFFCYRQSKDLSFIRSENTNQVSYTNDEVNRNEAQYSTLLHSDVGLYELINGLEEAANGTNNEPEESADHSNVTMGSTADH